MKKLIKKMIRDAIDESFKSKLPIESTYNSNLEEVEINKNRFHGTFEKRVDELIEENVRIAAEKAIEDIVYRENFIDDIVKRIKNKQL